MPLQPPPIGEDCTQTARLCREALAADFGGLESRLPSAAPTTAPGWFDLLHGFPDTRKKTAALYRLEAATGRAGSLERFALLNAMLRALERLPTLPLDPSVQHLFCLLCRQVAAPPAAWERDFQMGGEAFMEIAKLATLRRHPAGQLVFDIVTLPSSWLLKIHPADLPPMLREIARLGGRGPFIAPHLNHWRPNPALLLEAENQRSLWRIARCIARRPDIRGIMADAWLYSSQVAPQFPHLAWLRRFFLDNGAHLVDLEAAPPDSGFLVGSARRRQLYERGLFRPRRTLVLWGRQEILAWAEAHPHLAGEAATPTPPYRRPVAPEAGPPPATADSRPCRRPLLINATPFLNRRPKLYILATLVAPALAVALMAGQIFSLPAVLAAALLTFCMMWMAQYFLFQ